jgi:hypothetical protein
LKTLVNRRIFGSQSLDGQRSAAQSRPESQADKIRRSRMEKAGIMTES